MQVCRVCTEQTPNYRCPTCKIRYCSLVCYKKHKETCLPANSPPALTIYENKPTISTDQWNVDDLLHEDDIIDKVPLDRLQLLGQSKKLQDLLFNPHLRQLLRSIDNVESKDHAMKAAMQEPLFVEFSDCCLKIVDQDVNLNDE
ncbi:zinc finger HIT domain-containing protein 3 [Eucyclogobius newberryi]|uniref:zinc finger HIT domain-containing protein 3 n=1 Tax=Eucyclogobius newberryi TaxID=166745 RepID=UPI003B5C3BFB